MTFAVDPLSQLEKSQQKVPATWSRPDDIDPTTCLSLPSVARSSSLPFFSFFRLGVLFRHLMWFLLGPYFVALFWCLSNSVSAPFRGFRLLSLWIHMLAMGLSWWLGSFHWQRLWLPCPVVDCNSSWVMYTVYYCILHAWYIGVGSVQCWQLLNVPNSIQFAMTPLWPWHLAPPTKRQVGNSYIVIHQLQYRTTSSKLTQYSNIFLSIHP